jgi:hypothetical protein
MRFDRPRHSGAECARLLNELLHEPAELLSVFAADGWERSPLIHALQPPPAQRIDAERKIVELIGHALWDIFSDNHTVLDADGTAYDFGSFRGSAGFIAESTNRRYPHLDRTYDYLDFYMGSIGLRERADLRPIYRWIFVRLEATGCRWIYSFPRLYLVDLSDAPADDDAEDYDPSEAVRRELARDKDAEQVRALREQFDRAFEEDLARAQHAPLPATVAAYRDVFGALPEGWPHPEI